MRPLHGPDDMECGWFGGWLIRRRLEAFGHRVDERRLGMAKQQPAWLEGVEISGRQLAVAGLPMPILNPETALLLHLRRR